MWYTAEVDVHYAYRFSGWQMPSKLLTLADHAVLGPRQLNPEAREANLLTKRLCQQFSIYHPKFDGYHTMAGFVFPRTSLERLAYINLWFDWLWFTDEIYDRDIEHEYSGDLAELRAVLTTAVDIVCDGYQPQVMHRLYPACLALHKWLSETMSAAWLARFKRSLGKYDGLMTVMGVFDDGGMTAVVYRRTNQV